MSHNRTPVGIFAYQNQLKAQKAQFADFQEACALDFVACQAFLPELTGDQKSWLRTLAGKQQSIMIGVNLYDDNGKRIAPLWLLSCTADQLLNQEGKAQLVWLPAELSADQLQSLVVAVGQRVERIQLKATEQQSMRWFVRSESLRKIASNHWEQFRELVRQYLQSQQYFPLTQELNSRLTNPMNDEWEGNFDAWLELAPEKLPQVELAPFYVQPAEPPPSAKADASLTLYPSINTYELDRQLDALKQLHNPRKPSHQRLQALFRPPIDAEDLLQARYRFDEAAFLPNWQVLTDAERDGTDQQRNFVQKALQTPDFAVLEGPPGSGKTTAIHELILQLLALGKRVLLVSATHVAIDNVLEKLMEPHQAGELMACRISSSPKAIASEAVRSEMWMPNLMNRLAEATQRHIRCQRTPSQGQQMLVAALNGLKEDFEDFVIQQADVVAGTLVGILQHNYFRYPRPTSRPFDYLIVDEASKVTVPGFLVPALHAERWVLVGDTQQLAPYSDSHSLLPYLAQLTRLDTDGTAQVFRGLEELFAYRMLPDFVRGTRHKLKQQLGSIPPRQRPELEQFRRVAFPSILDALQHGTALGWLYPLPKDGETLLSKGFAAIDSTDPDAWESRFESLRYQSRMCDEIARWARELFYGGKNLETANRVMLRPNPLRDYRLGAKPEAPVVWRKLDPKSAQQDNTNRQEADAVDRELNMLHEYAQTRGIERLSVAVLTFYRGQENLLKRKLKRHLEPPKAQLKNGPHVLDVTLCTVDRFQGQEADVVLLCFTKWHGRPFYNVPNRLNVAITRARHKLILLGAPSLMRGDGFTHAVQQLADIDSPAG